jgi:hypothetical protein
MIIRVGAPPKSAFNQDRPISDLIRSQVEHLKHVEERLTPEQRSTIPSGEIKTEAEAAKYIAAITAVLQSGARVEQLSEVTPKVESIRKPLRKAPKKQLKKAPAAGHKLALAASAGGSKKKSASRPKKVARKAKTATSQAKKKTSGRATKKASKKTGAPRSRKTR